MFKPDKNKMDCELRARALVNYRVVLSYGLSEPDGEDPTATPETVVDADIARMKWLLRSLAEMVNLRWWASEVVVDADGATGRSFRWLHTGTEESESSDGYSPACTALHDDVVSAANAIQQKAIATGGRGAVLFDQGTKVLRKDFIEEVKPFVISVLQEMTADGLPGPRNLLAERVLLETPGDRSPEADAGCIDGPEGMWARAIRQYDTSFVLSKRAWYVSPALNAGEGGLVQEGAVEKMEVVPKERQILERVHAVLAEKDIADFEENVIRDETGQKRVNFFAVVDACMRPGTDDDFVALPYEVASLLAYCFEASGIAHLRDFLTRLGTRLAEILGGDLADSSVASAMFRLVHFQEFQDADDLGDLIEEFEPESV
jgi:hypothetical protein